MEYIRTIMGSIYKVDNNKYGVIEENGIFKKYCENMGHSWYSELVATKQSENLEELCEGFYIDEGNEFSFYQENAYENFEEAKRVFFTNFDRTSTLYAFIKTSKGLIYVAKMNEEGELELL